MAVSKRTRYEVLRRDNFTCRYCRSAEGELTVDHVTPVALGGEDIPGNLVACCKDCNAGKTSTMPDAQTVTDVAEETLRWAAALKRAAEIKEAEGGSHDMLGEFYDFWQQMGLNSADLPNGWEESVMRFYENGMTMALLKDAATKSLTRTQVAPWQKFRYFCGICWKVVGEIRERAEQLLAGDED
jgi:hypothetical protein